MGQPSISPCPPTEPVLELGLDPRKLRVESPERGGGKGLRGLSKKKNPIGVKNISEIRRTPENNVGGGRVVLHFRSKFVGKGRVYSKKKKN